MNELLICYTHKCKHRLLFYYSINKEEYVFSRLSFTSKVTILLIFIESNVNTYLY